MKGIKKKRRRKMISKTTDLGKAFDTWVQTNFQNYRGVLLEKVSGGYKCMGIFCLNLKDADRVLNSGRSALAKSIHNPNTLIGHD
jgi:hypothetical protein